MRAVRSEVAARTPRSPPTRRAGRRLVAVLTAADVADLEAIPLRLDFGIELDPYLQHVLARDRVRYVSEPLAVVVAEDDYLARRRRPGAGRPRGAAGRARPGRRSARGRRACGRPRQRGRRADQALRRRRGGLRGRRPRRAGRAHGRAPHRHAARDARPGRPVGPGPRAPDGVGGGAGHALPPARALAAARAARAPHHHAQHRRRRQLRRARRLLPRGLPRPVPGHPHRPPGQVDRGPGREHLVATNHAREQHRIERPSRPTARCWACATRCGTTRAPTSAPPASWCRRSRSACCPGRTACPPTRAPSTWSPRTRPQSAPTAPPGAYEGTFARELLFTRAAGELGIDGVAAAREPPDTADLPTSPT
jgi:hypothetical protein